MMEVSRTKLVSYLLVGVRSSQYRIKRGLMEAWLFNSGSVLALAQLKMLDYIQAAYCFTGMTLSAQVVRFVHYNYILAIRKNP